MELVNLHEEYWKAKRGKCSNLMHRFILRGRTESKTSIGSVFGKNITLKTNLN